MSLIRCTYCQNTFRAEDNPLGCPRCSSKNLPEAGDMVSHPSHYSKGKFEVIDVLEDWKLEMHEANAVKYIARAKHKGNELQDLQKAAWYLNRKIQLLENNANM